MFASPFVIPVVAIVATFTFLSIATICHMIGNMYQVSRTLSMKQRLVEAGLSAAEIERIIGANVAELETDCQSVPKAKKPPISASPMAKVS